MGRGKESFHQAGPFSMHWDWLRIYRHVMEWRTAVQIGPAPVGMYTRTASLYWISACDRCLLANANTQLSCLSCDAWFADLFPRSMRKHRVTSDRPCGTSCVIADLVDCRAGKCDHRRHVRTEYVADLVSRPAYARANMSISVPFRLRY